ncbi:MAG: TolC family protein [Candidatus Omnitrophota bacterium]
MVLKKGLILLMIAALSVSSGCRTVRAPGTPLTSWFPTETIQKKFSTNEIWGSLQKRKADASGSLDIGDLIDMALSNNPRTHQAWEEARVMEARAIQSSSAWFPTVQATMGAEYRRSVVNRHKVNVNQSGYGPGASVDWLIFDFGGRSAGVEKARQLLIEANFEFNQAIQDVLLDTMNAYYSIMANIAMVDAREDDVADSLKSFDDARERLKAGLVSKLDELQAESSYKRALYALEDAKRALSSAKTDLAVVLGLPANVDIELAEMDGEDTPDISEQDVALLIEQALRQRPDIAAGRAGLEAKKSEIVRVTSDLLPSLKAGGSAETNWYTYYGAMKDTLTSYKDDYLYGGYLKLEWDVFDGFNNYYRRKEAQRELEAEQQKLISAHLNASREVWDSYFAFVSAGKKYEYSKAFLDTAEMSYDIALEGYRSGLKNIIDLLSSQSQLSDARSKFIQSKQELFSGSAGLFHAIGSLTAEHDNREGILRP